MEGRVDRRGVSFVLYARVSGCGTCGLCGVIGGAFVVLISARGAAAVRCRVMLFVFVLGSENVLYHSLVDFLTH